MRKLVERRGALIEDILRLEPAAFMVRCLGQPPPLLDIDVTMAQLKTLFVLFMEAWSEADGGLRVSDIAGRLGVTAATTSTLLDRLVERGLVERREDPLDRRQHRCRVSTP